MSFNVAIIGAGLIGKKRALALSGFKECQIKVIVDSNLEAAVRLSKELGGDVETEWEKVVVRKDIDIVNVATVNKFLAPISIAALRNGKHVLCEKPLGRNRKESERIIDEAKKNGAVLKTGFNHRHHPAIIKAKYLVNNDALGKVYYIRCVYGHGGRQGYEKEWRTNKGLSGGGELLDQGVHVVDLFRWFLGEFKEVHGLISTYYWNVKVEDTAFALFKTRKGQTAIMHTSWTQWKNRFNFEIYGEKGYLIVDGLGGSYGTERLIVGKRKKSIYKKGSFLEGPPDERILKFPGPDISCRKEWQEFFSAIKENREPLGSGYDGLMANKLIEAVYESARIGRTVKI